MLSAVPFHFFEATGLILISRRRALQDLHPWGLSINAKGEVRGRSEEYEFPALFELLLLRPGASVSVCGDVNTPAEAGFSRPGQDRAPSIKDAHL